MAETVQNVIQQQVLKAAQIIEERLDEEIKQLDELKSDDIETLRERRLMQLKNQAKKRQEYLAKGHGEYDELGDEKQFFEIVKKSPNVVVHFYRESTPRCKIVDHHLKIIAKRHLETRFCRVLADRCLFLAEKLKIRVIPTIALIKDSNAKDYIVGFTDLGNCDDFSTDMLEWRIARSGAIEYDGDLLNPPDQKKVAKASNSIHSKTSHNWRDTGSDLDDD
jgi:thioredoxin-like negative regulator of GroEL